MNTWRILALSLLFTWFYVGGIAHFGLTDLFVSVVPSYVPFPRPVVLLTGLCEIAGALGIVSKRLRPLAGAGLALFAACVIPVHIEMLRNADDFPQLGEPVLWGRLLFQPVLIVIIWWATRPWRIVRGGNFETG